MFHAIVDSPQSLNLVAFSADTKQIVAIVRIRKMLVNAVKVGPLYANTKVRRNEQRCSSSLHACFCFQLAASTILRAALEQYKFDEDDARLEIEGHTANRCMDELMHQLTDDHFESGLEAGRPLFTHELLDLS